MIRPRIGQPEPAAKKRPRISLEVMARASLPAQGTTKEKDLTDRVRQAFAAAKPFPGTLPNRTEEKKLKIAMDDAMSDIYAYTSDIYAYSTINSIFAEGLTFMGYPYLSELTQRAEYRRPVEIIAKEMTRKWIKLHSTNPDGDADAEKLVQLDKELKRLGVQGLFCKAIEHDGFFGRAQIYIDLGMDTADRDEMKSPLLESKAKIKKGKGIERLTLVEPIWTYPNWYNANDPLEKTFFKPETWFVMGKEIHNSRFLTFVSREVPDLLKPAYAFGGLSLSQMLKPYVDNWLRTRQSVSDIIHAFSVFVLKTNMSDMLDGGAAQALFDRLEVFTRMRDNRGAFVVDQETEDFTNVSAPLGSLDHLQAQAQEHMSGVVGAPLVVMFGISPSGLNASSEGEMKAWQDWIAGKQESDLTLNLSRLINIIQLSLWGEIDPNIGFTYEPLWSLDARQKADLRKVDADTDAVLIDRGVIDPGESRARVAKDKESPYGALDLDKEITPPDSGGGGEELGVGKEPGAEMGESTAAEDELAGVSMDAEFDESKHLRDGGKFASSSSAPTEPVVVQKARQKGHPIPPKPASGGEGSGGEKQTISKAALKEKLAAMSKEKLMKSLNNPDVDPKIKKHIEEELDDRASRGA
jgi:phage-related protein (TIGR01555 family)